MFYRLSSRSSRSSIEREFSRPFSHAHLYKPQTIVHGLEEASLPIVCMDEPDRINFGIWGLLPDTYMGDWKKFQDTSHTLHFSLEDLRNRNVPSYFKDPIKRCLIIVSGYFIFSIDGGELVFHHVFLKSAKPFAIAGVYNRLDDGFLTCSMLTERLENQVDQISPVILCREGWNQWLNEDLKLLDVSPRKVPLSLFKRELVEIAFENETTASSEMIINSGLKVV